MGFGGDDIPVEASDRWYLEWWEGARVRTAAKQSQAPRGSTAVYQPVRGEKQLLTHKVHQHVR